MANHRPPNSRLPDDKESLDQRLDDLLALYIERFNAGELVNPGQIIEEHPDLGPEIVRELDTFLDIGSKRIQDETLGTLGDYTLRRQIGRGGMGVVYEAWQGSMDRVVALKVLPPAVAADDRAYGRFMQEARAAGKLSHPNVVAVHASGQDEQTPYYAMEFVDGETLAQILAKIKDAEPETETPFGKKDRPAYFEKLAESFADVADGLQHAHSKGVTHRDIKPSNLILDSEGRLRILDFGLARLEGQESLTLSGDFVGTPLYMSPEQARRKKIPVDHRTDVYSLGATMYEAICGRPPFRGKDHADTLSQIIDRDPVEPRKVNPRVPRDLETIVLKCLRKDSGDRYGTAEALGQDLRRFVRGDPIEARPQGRWEKWGRQTRRHRGKLVVALVSVPILFLVAWLGWKHHQEAHHRRLAEYKQTVLQAVMRIYRGQFALKGGSGQSISVIDDVEAARKVWLLRVPDLGGFLGKAGLPYVLEAVEMLEEATSSVPEEPEAHYHLARAYLLLGHKDKSLEELDRTLVCRPDFLPAQVLGRELSQETLDSEVADIEALRWATADRDRDTWESWWLLAHLHEREENWQGAVEAYGKLLAYGEEPYLGFSIEVYMGRGIARLRNQQPEGALRDFASAWGRWRDFPEPALLLGKTYYEIGKHKEAEDVFLELYETVRLEARPEMAAWIAVLYETLGDEKKVKEWSNRVTGSLEHQQRVQTLFFDDHNLKEAAAASRELLEIDPENRLGLIILATSLLEMQLGRFGPEREKELGEARKVTQDTVRLYPNEPTSWCILAYVLKVEGHLDEAESAAKRCYELQERTGIPPIMAWEAYGHIRLEQGQDEEAEEYCRRAVEVEGDEKFAHWDLGRVLTRVGKYEEAADQFRRAIKAKPKWGLGYAWLAGVLNEQGKFKEAIEKCKLALDRFPRNTPAHEHLAFALWKLGQDAEALAAADKGIEAIADRPRLHLVRGWIMGSQENVKEAARSFSEAVRLHPEYDEAREELADLIRRHGAAIIPAE